MKRLVTLSMFLLAEASVLLVAGQAGDQQLQQRTSIGKVAALTPEQEEILGHMSIVYLNDGAGGTCKTIRITGTNLQIVNGLGATNGYTYKPWECDPLLTQTNCVGNLIVGYNELDGTDVRTGSHNLVVGPYHSYSSFGGMLGGLNNEIGLAGCSSSVTGGTRNRATAKFTAITAGAWNETAGSYSAIHGGGGFAPTSGNTTWGEYSSILGGSENFIYTNGNKASISGGYSNEAYGGWSSVSGGSSNLAWGVSSSISGGYDNTVVGKESTITGGFLNVVGYDWSSIGGGQFRNDTGDKLWMAGNLFTVVP